MVYLFVPVSGNGPLSAFQFLPLPVLVGFGQGVVGLNSMLNSPSWQFHLTVPLPLTTCTLYLSTEIFPPDRVMVTSAIPEPLFCSSCGPATIVRPLQTCAYKSPSCAAAPTPGPSETHSCRNHAPL